MNLIFFAEQGTRDNLLPFTFLRPVSEIRIGILTIREKWQMYFSDAKVGYLTQPYLQKKYPLNAADDNLLINSSICPDDKLVEAISNLKIGQLLQNDELIIALRLDRKLLEAFTDEWTETLDTVEYYETPFIVENLWDIFVKNEQAIASDFKLVTKGRKSAKLSATNRVIGEENIFVEEGAVVEFATINAKDSFVYIGKDAEIMEGSMIRGSLALCEHSQLKMGAKIYGATTIGPYSKVGGEVNNSVIFGYSNKAHDGFLGNSVIGEWCNLGADTNNSNLKNNYAPVKIWNYTKQGFINTGLQFCGLFMGDHSKCGINTMFNTGTVVGVSSNIYGSGFPRNFVPSFTWGGPQGVVPFELEKAEEVATRAYERRDKKFDRTEKDIFSNVFRQTRTYRDLRVM